MSAAASDVPHFPVLRAGKEYSSLDRVELTSHRDGSVVASVSQANAGLVRRDMRKLDQNAQRLRAMPMAERIERCREAARCALSVAGLGTAAPHANSAGLRFPAAQCVGRQGLFRAPPLREGAVFAKPTVPFFGPALVFGFLGAEAACSDTA